MQTSLPFLHTQVALLHLQDGGLLLAAAPSSSTGRSHLFLIPLPGGSVKKIPLHDNGACVAAGHDGCLYLGTHTGRLLRYDPASDAIEDIAHPFDGEHFNTAFCSSTGKIFFVSSPSALIVEYDPAGGMVNHHRCSDQSHAQQAYVITELPDGRMIAFLHGHAHSACILSLATTQWECQEITSLVGEECVRFVVPFDEESIIACTMSGRRLFRLNMQTLDVISPFPPLPDDAIFCLQRVGDDILASGISGAIYRYTQESWERLGMPMPNDPLTFTALPDYRIAGVTYHGRLLQSASDKRMYMVSALPTRETDGLVIKAMGMSPDRQLYFTFAENMRMGSWDPDNEDDITERFVASPFPGEVTALGFAGERLLIGVADACGVMAYYPELPYRLMENPRFIGLAGNVRRQPIGPMVHHESNVYFAAAAVTHHETGAIVRINPLDNEVTAFQNIIPEQNITSIVADRLSGLLVAGGQVQERPRQKTTAARLAFWSPYQEETVRIVTPLPDAKTIHVWAAEGGRIYATDGGSRLVILSSDGDVLEAGDFPLGCITSLMTNQDGKLYGLAGEWMFHLDAEKGCVERLVKATGSMLTEVRRGLFAIADGGRISTVQIW
ncbi:MAG TPA: hypothetical protein VHV83_00815 [Armatimonadota bacterium]|nr:hypothetical protein [Armatimonadota bacterium]